MSIINQRLVFAVLQLTIGVILTYFLFLVEQRIRSEWLRIVLDICIGGSILGLFFTGACPLRYVRDRSDKL